ncbi:vesicle-associated membrane [Stylonychia lemnae]|uniref:Vesicle-associated membrane n=1 Tax=Stylonychia lemnae TaxID=5949 RepID=A0A078AI83_STYLE|nr:vesicle-associated membrane [Stylonychia lemnae]|eukprot:CDW81914.1 vesicle-associated membrane [Stylonychia lemnae]
MSIHYSFIARDSEMIVFEILLNKDYAQKPFKRDIKDKIVDLDSIPTESRPAREQTSNFGNSKDDLKLSIFYSTVYFGCVTDSGYPEEKLYRFLEDLKKEFSAIYKGNLGYIFKQTNLTPNCYDKAFKAAFNKVLDNYNTGISNKNLQNAFRKVEEVKDIAARSITTMIDNNKETEQLLSKSQSTLMLAKDFEKNSEALEKTMERQNFWLCSKKCIIMFGGGAIIVILLYVILSFMFCGNANMFGGCDS